MKNPFSPPHSKQTLNQSLERRAHQKAEFKSRKCKAPQGSQGSQGFQIFDRPQRRVEARPCDKSCFVYILVHSKEHRMKIGMSDAPLIRLSQLPEAGQIDRARSLQVELPNRQRTSEVESSLRQALSTSSKKFKAVNALLIPNAHAAVERQAP